MTTAAELYALQETDLAIDAARQRLAETESRLGETEELRAQREEVARRREELAGLRHRQREEEREVEELRRKAKAVEDKLYGGTVRNPKELQDLQEDLEALKRQLSRREDALLNLMLQVEEAERLLGEAEARLAETEAVWRDEQASLLAEKGRLEEELSRLEGERARQVVKVDASTLGLYDALRARRQGRAVARVERGMCQGCRISLPMSVLQRLRSGNALVQCVSCERILYAG